MVFYTIMGAEGNFSPDPSTKPDENFLPTDVGVIADSESDSDGEEISYEGYQVLPQESADNCNFEVNDDDDEDDSQSSEENEEETDVNHPINIREPPSFDQSTNTELTELWNGTNTDRLTDIVIDSTKEEQIKNAMAGFKLPLSSIPPWAAHISEEEWKEQLKKKVAMLNNTR